MGKFIQVQRHLWGNNCRPTFVWYGFENLVNVSLQTDSREKLKWWKCFWVSYYGLKELVLKAGVKYCSWLWRMASLSVLFSEMEWKYADRLSGPYSFLTQRQQLWTISPLTCCCRWEGAEKRGNWKMNSSILMVNPANENVCWSGCRTAPLVSECLSAVSARPPFEHKE